jgi:ribonuclease J
VIFSATPIPGNERSVNETVDRIYEIGARVVTAADAPIHVSGHGSREELKLMLNLTRPRHVFPFHGDHKRIRLHADLAESVGIDADRIFKGRNGLTLEIDEQGARFTDDVDASMIFVDGVEIGDPDDVALRDRRELSADGIFIVVATVSANDGSQVAAPEVLFRGVPFLDDDDSDGLIDELRDAVGRSLEQASGKGVTDPILLEEDLHDDIAEFVYERLRRRPMILPVVVEV